MPIRLNCSVTCPPPSRSHRSASCPEYRSSIRTNLTKPSPIIITEMRAQPAENCPPLDHTLYFGLLQPHNTHPSSSRLNVLSWRCWPRTPVQISAVVVWSSAPSTKKSRPQMTKSDEMRTQAAIFSAARMWGCAGASMCISPPRWALLAETARGVMMCCVITG